MPLQHDQQRRITQGWAYCRPPDECNFVKCFIVLDRPKQLLICYKRPTSAPSIQDSQTAHHDSWPVLKNFKTDSISLVEEAHKIKKQYCFAVHSLAKVTHFCAESWKDMEEWMDCIKDASRISVDVACLNPNRISMIGSYTAEVVGGTVVQTPVQPEEAGSSNGAHNLGSGSLRSNCSDHPSTDSVSGHIIRKGYCVKQGAMMKNWKRRFLSLSNDELTYSKSEFAGKPLKRISVQDIKDVRVSNSEISSVRSNLIDLVTPDRTFYMQFDSMIEMYSWLEDIRKASDLPIVTYL